MEERQARQIRWILFYVFTALFLVIVVLTMLAVFFGLGDLSNDHKDTLLKVFLVEIGGAVIALFYSVFKLKKSNGDKTGPIKDDASDLDVIALGAPREINEDTWLEHLRNYMQEAEEALVYLRYFRDPLTEEDTRVQARSGVLQTIMQQFARLIAAGEGSLTLIGYRQPDWSDSPLESLERLVSEMLGEETKNTAHDLVSSHVRVISRQPLGSANSSTFYLVDGKYLFYNKVRGQAPNEVVDYFILDLKESLIPQLIDRGFRAIPSDMTPASK